MKKIYIGKSPIQGKGIFAGENINKGDLIQYISGRRVRKLPRTKKEALSIPTWFGLSRQFWMDPKDGVFRFLNHSCAPNAAIRGTKSLVALHPIKEGDEVTIDYSITDADPLWEMSCKCGSVECRGIIRSIHFIPPEVFRKHMPYIPRYFQRVYIRNYITGKLKLSHARTKGN